MKNRNMNLTSHLYLKLLPIHILSCAVISINSFIDSLFAGRCIGAEALAMIGLFGPVMTIFSGLASVISTGAQTLCCRHIGRGDVGRLRQSFSVCFLFLSGTGIVFGALIFLFRMQLASLLGAQGILQEELAAYITGISLGVIGQLLSVYLMSFLQINGRNRLSYFALAANVLTNTVFNAIFIYIMKMGLLGMGLATSLSVLLCTAIVLPVFFKEESAASFCKKHLSVSDILEAGKAGLPVVMFNVGIILKSLIMNHTLLVSGSVAAVAVLTMQGNICSLTGAVTYGVGTSVLLLSNVYIGEEDRDSLKQLMAVALKTGIFLTLVIMVGLNAFSGSIIRLFQMDGGSTGKIALHMLRIFPIYLPISAIYSVFIKLYQGVGKMNFVNIMTFAESILQALFTVLFLPALGTDAAWLAFPVTSVICLITVFVYGCGGKDFRCKKNFLSFLKLPEDFGASEENRLALSVRSMDEVVNLSEKVISFCKKHGIDDRRSMVSGLCIEEMAGNVVKHGFSHKGKETVWIFVIYKNNILTLRFRDNCRQFNPTQYLEIFHPADPAAGIGIRMIAKMTDTMEYQNSFGLNMLTIKL